jgi:hypothetical protein
MQRFPSAVVLLSAVTLWPVHAAAQTPKAPPPSGETPATKKPDSRLSDEAELARIAGLYEAGKYRECSDELERLLDPLGKAPLKQSAIVENARVYWSACLLGAGATDGADAPLRAAIHENPQMKPPDSLVFPQPVVQLFLRVRDSLVNEIRAAEQERLKQAQAEARRREEERTHERARMAALESLAQEESVVVQNRRVLSFIPFGVGQLQNREEALGYTFMVSEVLLGSLSLAAIAIQSRRAAIADELRRRGDPPIEEEHSQDQKTWGVVKVVSGWAFVGAAVAGVVQAQLAYVPEFREKRRRPLPPALRRSSSLVAPSDVSAVPYADPTGGGLNIVGRF